MKNTKKIAAAFIAALTLAGIGLAHAQTPQCVAANPMMPNPVARVQAQADAMVRFLALKESQKKAFSAYQTAREEFARKMSEFLQQCAQKPCVDEQSRLERRAEHHAVLGAAFRALATSRANFVKVLDAQQRLVLETLEADRGFSPCPGHGPRGVGMGPGRMGHGAHGMGMGPGRMGHGPTAGDGPRRPGVPGMPCPMKPF